MSKESWRWHLATWLFHGLLTAIGMLLHERVGFGLAFAYTFREIEQRLRGSKTVWYDSVGDALAPWLVYALLR